MLLSPSTWYDYTSMHPHQPRPTAGPLIPWPGRYGPVTCAKGPVYNACAGPNANYASPNACVKACGDPNTYTTYQRGAGGRGRTQGERSRKGAVGQGC